MLQYFPRLNSPSIFTVDRLCINRFNPFTTSFVSVQFWALFRARRNGIRWSRPTFPTKNLWISSSFLYVCLLNEYNDMGVQKISNLQFYYARYTSQTWNFASSRILLYNKSKKKTFLAQRCQSRRLWLQTVNFNFNFNHNINFLYMYCIYFPFAIACFSCI